MDPTQFAIAMSVPTLALLIGIPVNNSRLSDLRAYMDQRFSRIDQQFADSREMWRSELRRVEEVLDARLKHLEER